MTAESKHTPGPWHYKPTTIGHPDNRINPVITTGFDQPHYIARVGWAGSTIQSMTSLAPATFEEAEANARLISAAPDMLAALERLLSLSTTELHFALTECCTGHCEPGNCAQANARAAIAKALSPSTGKTTGG